MSKASRSTPSRDARRVTRHAQMEQRRAERQRAEARRQRNARIKRICRLGGGSAAALLLTAFLVHAVTSGASTKTAIDGPTSTAQGQTIDGLACGAEMASALHYHVYFEMYANGRQINIPANTGIVQSGQTSCFYPLHVHPENANIVHVESPIQRPFSLGQVFDIWTQPLSQTNVLNYQANSRHAITYEVFDAHGTLSQVTQDPRAVQLADHQTVVILYNSPNAHPAAFTDWQGLP
jgi:hypothetical protein